MRKLLFTLMLVIAVADGAPAARADDPAWQHGISLLGGLKYPQGFKHFDYVNPQAPKGGRLRMSALGTFDSFNLALSQVKGQAPASLTLVYQTLMTPALDEINTEYGLIAEAVRHPPDNSSVSFRINAGARWHDGTPITPEDVMFSMEQFKKLSPYYNFYYRNVERSEKSGAREVTFHFNQKGNRELPQIVGQLIVLPKHWWEGTAPDGRKRDISQTTLEPPLGSGPYRVGAFQAGRSVTFERVKDFWGKDLPTRIGKNNFDEIRYDYFRDDTVRLEAFKADQIDFRFENVARNWATGYDFPALRQGKVLLEAFDDRAQGLFQGFVVNLRHERFKDQRVRLALNYAFDFEEANKTLFFGLYNRVSSYFHGLDFAVTGLPEGAEKALLEQYRDKIPAEIFTQPYANPVTPNQQAARENLRRALGLMREAGWDLKDGRLVNAKGERFRIEMLVESPTFERVMLFYKSALDRIGFEVSVRVVDSTQYENRVRNREFDMIISAWGQSPNPGNEQRDFWGSAAADSTSSSNHAGIKDPVVDALIEKIIFSQDRDSQLAAIKALDRVLLFNHYMIPNWASGKQRTARWDRFGRPDRMPEYGSSAFPTIWWLDADKVAKIGAGK